MRAKLTEEQRNEIATLYEQGMGRIELSEKYGVTGPYISKISNARGVRRKKASIDSGEKKCPKCRANNPQKARFCMYCGVDVRDEKQIVTEQLARLREMVVLLPESVRGEADEITRKALRFFDRKVVQEETNG